MDSGETVKDKLTACEVGMFKLPGLIMDVEQYSEQQIEEMQSWAKENGATRMTETLWSFRKEAMRDWFVLKWG